MNILNSYLLHKRKQVKSFRESMTESPQLICKYADFNHLTYKLQN